MTHFYQQHDVEEHGIEELVTNIGDKRKLYDYDDDEKDIVSKICKITNNPLEQARLLKIEQCKLKKYGQEVEEPYLICNTDQWSIPIYVVEGGTLPLLSQVENKKRNIAFFLRTSGEIKSKQCGYIPLGIEMITPHSFGYNPKCDMKNLSEGIEAHVLFTSQLDGELFVKIYNDSDEDITFDLGDYVIRPVKSTFAKIRKVDQFPHALPVERLNRGEELNMFNQTNLHSIPYRAIANMYDISIIVSSQNVETSFFHILNTIGCQVPVDEYAKHHPRKNSPIGPYLKCVFELAGGMQVPSIEILNECKDYILESICFEYKPPFEDPMDRGMIERTKNTKYGHVTRMEPDSFYNNEKKQI